MRSITLKESDQTKPSSISIWKPWSRAQKTTCAAHTSTSTVEAEPNLLGLGVELVLVHAGVVHTVLLAAGDADLHLKPDLRFEEAARGPETLLKSHCCIAHCHRKLDHPVQPPWRRCNGSNTGIDEFVVVERTHSNSGETTTRARTIRSQHVPRLRSRCTTLISTQEFSTKPPSLVVQANTEIHRW